MSQSHQNDSRPVSPVPTAFPTQNFNITGEQLDYVTNQSSIPVILDSSNDDTLFISSPHAELKDQLDLEKN